MKKAGFLHLLAGLLLGWLGAGCVRAELKVATLHPLLTDLAQQVGGDKVKVMAVVKAGTDVHHFSPSTQHMRQVAGADVVWRRGRSWKIIWVSCRIA